jgi:TetR/AcrR family acrAB operon transcriptional repressor
MTTQQKLIDALKALAATNDPSGLTIVEVARLSGLSRPTVSRHVGGSNGLRGFMKAHGIDEVNMESGDVKSEIVEAAFRVFGEKGYAATSMDAVAADAGVTKGAVYWHFENKRDLFRELMMLRSSEGIRIGPSRLDDAADEAGNDPLRILSVLVEHQIRLTEEERTWWWLFFEYLTEARDETLRSDLAIGLGDLLKANEFLVDSMKESKTISSNVDNQGLSLLWQATLIGFGYLNLMNPDFLQNQNLGAKIAESLWNGLKPEV